MIDQQPLPTESSKPSGARTEDPQANLEACLAALDHAGEAGLQAALDKIYGPVNPPNRLIFPDGSAGRLKEPLPEGMIAPSQGSAKAKQ